MKRIESSVIPQADQVLRLLDVLEAIKNGETSAKEIADYCDLPSSRQGSYYRLAAESVGLIKRKDGEWLSTELGDAVVDIEDHREKIVLMRPIVLLNPSVRLLYGALEDSAPSGLTENELASLLAEKSSLSHETAIRRAQTVARWFSILEVVDRKEGRLVLKRP